MQEEVTLRCPNCGTEWSSAAALQRGEPAMPGDLECPVCHYRLPADGAPDEPQISSRNELETQLSTLMSLARTSGVAPEEIVNVLRDELEFAAEMAHRGHQFSVQLIDLGPQQADIPYRPQRDHSKSLRARGTTG